MTAVALVAGASRGLGLLISAELVEAGRKPELNGDILTWVVITYDPVYLSEPLIRSKGKLLLEKK